MTKGKKNLKPILLTSAIIGFLVTVVCVFAAICRIARNNDITIINSQIVYMLHIVISVLAIAALVLAMIFIVSRKSYTTNSKRLNTKLMVILNAVFWGAVFVVTLFGALPLLIKKMEIGGLTKKDLMPIIWIVIAILPLPISIINTISFVKAK
ncbi:MAG: hypothetical protein ACOQNV_02390 [Mycoplasmoidaceae bacterium]